MSLRLDCSDEQEEVELPAAMESKLQQLLLLAGEMEAEADGEVTVTFVDDEAIRELNRQYRNMDKATDVLSFPMREQAGDGAAPPIRYEADDGTGDVPEEPLGDIVISLPAAARQSEQYGHSLEREIGFLFVHGLLHLLGYDHPDEPSERIMTDKQERVLQQAGLFR